MPLHERVATILRDFYHDVWPCWAGPALVGTYVYVLVVKNGTTSIPVYVGQTRRFRARMGDYSAKQFAASTDFKVGEAAEYLQRKGLAMEVCYKLTAQAIADENALISLFQEAGFHLLNNLRGYKYSSRTSDNEAPRIHRFVDMLLREGAHTTYPSS